MYTSTLELRAKFISVALGGTALRMRSHLAVGLTGRVEGVPLGDLITAIHKHDDTHLYKGQRLTSNNLANWFHSLAGPAAGNRLVSEWLGRPAGEAFPGRYLQIAGAPAVAPLPTRIDEASNAVVSIAPDPARDGKKLSLHTLVEALKRLVTHAEDAQGRLPGLQMEDIRTLLYGASDSVWYPSRMGGMCADTSVYIQAALDALDLEEVERRSQGKWRLFSKLGFSGANKFVHVGYACLPVLDSASRAEWGKEFVTAWRAGGAGRLPETMDAALARAYRAIIARIVDGTLA